MKTTQRKVLPAGSWVQLTDVDEHGFCGRDYYPAKEDEGLIGVITKVLEHGNFSDTSTSRSTEPGTHVTEDSFVVYEVCGPWSRRLELVDHEFDVWP
jgi:hypothetical protein